MQTFTKYADLLAWVEQEKSPTTFLGCAPDGAPVISIRTGGDKTPAVFISAGSHATEQAGVSAAVALVEQLKTDHQVHIIPTRDPIGMNGFAYALGLSLEETPQLNSLEEIPGFLQAHGDILYQRDEVMLVLIGEYGYSTHNLYNKIDHGDLRLEPLWGSRIFPRLAMAELKVQLQCNGLTPSSLRPTARSCTSTAFTTRPGLRWNAAVPAA